MVMAGLGFAAARPHAPPKAVVGSFIDLAVDGPKVSGTMMLRSRVKILDGGQDVRKRFEQKMLPRAGHRVRGLMLGETQ